MMAGFVKRAPRSIPPKLGKPKRTKINSLTVQLQREPRKEVVGEGKMGRLFTFLYFFVRSLRYSASYR